MLTCPGALLSNCRAMAYQYEGYWDKHDPQKRKETCSPLVSQILEQLPSEQWEDSTEYVSHQSNAGKSRSRKDLFHVSLLSEILSAKGKLTPYASSVYWNVMRIRV